MDWFLYDRNEHGRYELNVGKGAASDEMVLDISLINRGEDAHEATVTVTVPECLAFRQSDEQVQSVAKVCCNVCYNIDMILASYFSTLLVTASIFN